MEAQNPVLRARKKWSGMSCVTLQVCTAKNEGPFCKNSDSLKTLHGKRMKWLPGEVVRVAWERKGQTLS
jgi:hypothetical protein